MEVEAYASWRCSICLPRTGAQSTAESAAQCQPVGALVPPVSLPAGPWKCPAPGGQQSLSVAPGSWVFRSLLRGGSWEPHHSIPPPPMASLPSVPLRGNPTHSSYFPPSQAQGDSQVKHE